MASTKIRDLIELLRSRTFPDSAGLWILPLAMLGTESDEAAGVGIDAVDARGPILNDLEPNSKYIGLDVDYLSRAVESIAAAKSGSPVVLVYNLDILLARLSPDERNRFWQHIYSGFKHRPRCLIFTMPETATELLPDYALFEAWRHSGRLVESSI